MIAIAAFIIGVLVGLSSWLFAAAWLETCRSRRENGRRRRRLFRWLPRLGSTPVHRAI